MSRALEVQIEYDPLAQYFGAIGAAVYAFKSKEKIIFNKEEDLINHFGVLLSYTAAMNVEKETLELIEKDIEISVFKERRDYIREKLCINYYENRKEYEKEYIKYIFPKIYR